MNSITSLIILSLTMASGSICLADGSSATTRSAEISPVGDDPAFKNVRLDWHDEFDGKTVDTEQWMYRTDSKLWSTQLADNVSVSDGAMHITLKKEEARDKHYTGGGLISKKTFEYGYYEARLRCPAGAGWHTAFWAMKYDGKGGTGTDAQTQEIDFVEQDSVKPTTWTAGLIDWGGKKPGAGFGRKWIDAKVSFSSDYHVFGCEYTPTSIRFFLDGQFTHGADTTTTRQGPQEIWLTCIAAPNGGAKKVNDETLPATADFDYVRFFRPANPKDPIK